MRQISAGYDHAIALTTSGHVFSWGAAGDPPWGSAGVVRSAGGGRSSLHARRRPDASAALDAPAADAAAAALGRGDDSTAAAAEAAVMQPRVQLVVQMPPTACTERPPPSGQLGRALDARSFARDAEDGTAFSAAAAPAEQLGRCELVAAGAFCSAGMPCVAVRLDDGSTPTGAIGRVARSGAPAADHDQCERAPAAGRGGVQLVLALSGRRPLAAAGELLEL